MDFLKQALSTVYILAIFHSNVTIASDDFLEPEENEPFFITPTKSTLSIHEAPNFVTKFSSDDLTSLGIDSVADALRLVPGMMVSDLHGSNTQAGYHGLAVSIPRRMDLLYNSSSLHRAGYAGIHWRRLPFWIQDVESIEVVRGSSVSDFGSNALTGAINLIQNSIALEKPVDVSIKAGSGDSSKARVGVRFGSGANHIYARVFGEKSSGYDFAKRSDEYEDSFDGTGVLLSGEHLLNNNMLLDWNMAYNDYEFTAPNFNFIGNSDLMGEGEMAEADQDSIGAVRPADEKNIHGVVKLSGASEDTSWNVFAKYSEFDRDQEILFCNIQGSFDPLFAELDASPNVHIDPVDFPLILQSGLSTGVVQLDASIVNPLDSNDIRILTELGQRLRAFGPNAILANICGDADISTSENRTSVGGQITQNLTENLQLSSGVEFIYSQADSENYFKGIVSKNTLQISNNLFYKPNKKLSFNLGLMAEGDDYLEKFVFSPRVNFNYSFNNDFTLKALYSNSKRTPDLHETDRKWQISVDYLDDEVDFLGQSSANVFRVSTSSDNLKPEKIETFELGFVYTSPNYEHIVDAKLFDENMSDLISEPFLYLDFNLTNNGEIRKKGFEASYTGNFENFKHGISYTYLDWDTSTPYETTLIARHIGSLWGIFDLTSQSKIGVSFNGHTGGKNNNYKVYTLNYIKNVSTRSTDIDFQVGFKRYPEYTYTFTEFSSEDPVAIGFESRNQYFAKVKLSY